MTLSHHSFLPSYVTLHWVSVIRSLSYYVFLHMAVHLSKLCLSIQAVWAARESWLIWARSHPESSFRACGPYLHIFHHLVWDLSLCGDVRCGRVNPLIFQRPFHNLQSHAGGLSSFRNDRTWMSHFFFPPTFLHKDMWFQRKPRLRTSFTVRAHKPLS